MKSSWLCLVVSATLVVQISSEVTEFNRMSSAIMQSVSRLARIPVLEVEKTESGKALRDNIKRISNTYSVDRQWVANKVDKILNDNLLTPEMKTIKNDVVKNVSQFTSYDTQKRIIDNAMKLLNDSFGKLPENIKLDILSVGHEVEKLLKHFDQKYYDHKHSSEKSEKH